MGAVHCIFLPNTFMGTFVVTTMLICVWTAITSLRFSIPRQPNGQDWRRWIYKGVRRHVPSAQQVSWIQRQLGCELAAFRRVNSDVLDKQCSVWACVKTGAPWKSIRVAYEKSRNLCMRCHSAFSIAKRYIGIQRLNPLHVSDCIKQMVNRKVETLVYSFNSLSRIR